MQKIVLSYRTLTDLRLHKMGKKTSCYNIFQRSLLLSAVYKRIYQKKVLQDRITNTYRCVTKVEQQPDHN